MTTTTFILATLTLVSDQMRTTVYWQGRRGPARDAALFAFGRFNPTMAVGGRRVGLPSAWSQTLDIRRALVTCEGAFDEGKSVCPWCAAKMSASMTELGDRTEPVRWLLEAAGAMDPFGETWEINEPGLRIHPWFTTASGNCVFAVNEMLVRGTVPKTWTDYAFRLPDGQGRWIDREVKGGRLVRNEVK